MKELTVTHTKLITTTAEERRCRNSWSNTWDVIGQMERKNGGVLIVFGEWSGYTDAQKRICHVGLAPFGMPEDYNGIVKFSDDTQMRVWVEKLKRRDLLLRNLQKLDGYSKVIRDLFKTGNSIQL